MTNTASMQFAESAILGRVFRVDTSSVWAEATDHERLTRVGVGSFVAIQGSNASEYLVGMLDRVTRDLQDEVLLDHASAEDDPVPVELRPRDLLRVVLLGTYRQIDGTKANTFKRGADTYPLVESPCWVIEGSNLQHLMGSISTHLEPEKQLRLGTFVADSSTAAIADGDRLFQRHAALLGSTGSGKSWSVALILERARALAFPNLIVLDMHGEYAPLTEGVDPIATGYRVAGPSDTTASTGALYLPWWLLNQEEMQALLLDRSEANAPNQAARLSHHVRDLKREALERDAKSDTADQITVDSPVPFSMTALLERLEYDDNEMIPGARANSEKAGPFNGRLTRFISRLRSRTEDRRFNFMFAGSDELQQYEWLHGFAKGLLGTSPGIKVIDFSEVPSDVLPIVVGVMTRVLYEIQFWTTEDKRTPVSLVCDEAHLYLPAGTPDAAEMRSLDVFERVAKEGRKYGMSLLVVSQRPADVSKTVLSQCNNFIALRLTNDQDQAVVRKLMPDSMDGVASALPLLDVGEALILGDALVLPTRVRLDAPRVKPASATKAFWQEWNEKPVDEDDLVAAVEAMRRQSRS